MEWQDHGIILSKKPHGETACVLSVLTKNHGRYMGLMRGQKRLKHLEPMTLVDALWKSRLEDQLGNFTLDVQKSFTHFAFDGSGNFALLSALSSLLHTVLPERQMYEGLFEDVLDVLMALGQNTALKQYVLFEVKLLAHLGYGLRLECCALTGTRENLAYVSPKTGRAASLAAGKPYASKLLKLPDFLYDETKDPSPRALYEGLVLTGYFMLKHCFKGSVQQLPFARTQLQEMCLQKKAA